MPVVLLRVLALRKGCCVSEKYYVKTTNVALIFSRAEDELNHVQTSLRHFNENHNSVSKSFTDVNDARPIIDNLRLKFVKHFSPAKTKRCSNNNESSQTRCDVVLCLTLV